MFDGTEKAVHVPSLNLDDIYTKTSMLEGGKVEPQNSPPRDIDEPH